MKNCDPLVFGPLFAIDITPRTLCLNYMTIPRLTIGMTMHFDQGYGLFGTEKNLSPMSLGYYNQRMKAVLFYLKVHYTVFPSTTARIYFLS